MPVHPIQFDIVADIYDAYVRVEFDIPFWISEARQINGRVLELACGTGRVSIPLLNAGIKLTCVDYAPGMLARFRVKLEESRLSCRLVCQDIAQLDLPERFDLIFIPFHSFSEILGDQNQRASMKHIRDHLTANGTFICTLQNPVVRMADMDGVVHLVGEFAMPNGESLIVKSRLIFDPATQLARGEQLYDHLGIDGSVIDHRNLDVCFRLFHKAQFEMLADESGFEVVDLVGDYDYKPFDERPSPFMLWKLKKKGSHA